MPAPRSSRPPTPGAVPRPTCPSGWAASDSDESQWSVQSVHVRPNDPEEGDIYADAPVVVFRSTAVLDVTPVVKGTTLTITGAVHAVDFARYDEDPAAELSEIDPRGAPLAGQRVNVRISEHTQVTRQTGTRYDFIAKRTIPVYESTTRTKTLPAQVATTRADGTFRLVVTVSGGDRSYEVIGTHADAAGRTVTTQESAWASEPRDDQGASLVRAGSDESWGTYGVGDTVRVRFANGITKPQVSRYLFTVLARGLRSAAVQGSPSFSTRFTSALVPNAHIRAVRFTGIGYEIGGEFGADLRVEDRALDVTLTADRDRYQPGDRVTVTVSTRSATGQPTSASVFVRAVDEKLFAMGAANMDDPLGELYESTGSGLVATGWSHASPIADDGDGKGDTTGGGGDREDFRDWLVAKLVTTGADGRAIVSFDLSDDLTSWRVVGSAITTGLTGGCRPRPCPGGAAVLRRGRRGAGVPGRRPARRPAPGLRVSAARRGPGPVHGHVVHGAARCGDGRLDGVRAGRGGAPGHAGRHASPAGHGDRPGAHAGPQRHHHEALRGREDAGHPCARHLRPAHPGHDRGRRRRSHAG